MDVDEESLETLDKSNGRLQVIYGTLFYSPNDSRTLDRIPKVDTPDCEDAREIFRPMGNISRIPLPVIRLQNACKPRWWTPAYGWTAFIPNPTEPITELIGPLLSPNSYQSNKRDEYPVPSNPRLLEHHLQRAVMALRHEFAVAVDAEDPTYYRTFDEHEWFFVLLGFLSSVISETEDNERWDLEIMQWHQVLRMNKFNSDWVNRLMGSIVYDQSDWCQRVGTFIDLNRLNVQKPDSLIHRLSSWSVPVWYRWLPEYGKNPLLAPLSPLPHQVQSLQVGLLQVPLKLALETSTLLRQALARPTIPTQEYKHFFASQSILHSCLRTDEAIFLFRRRKDSTHFPPDPCAKVFEWVVDSNNNWTRRCTPCSWRSEVLSQYANHQKRYNAISNEWDCWRDAASQRAGNFLITGNQDCVICPEATPWVLKCSFFAERNNALAPMNKVRFYTSLPTVDLDPLSFLSTTNATSSTNRFERYVLYVMHRFYGFTPPSKNSSITPMESFPQKFLLLLRFLGMPSNAITESIFDRPAIISAVQFVSKIFTNALLASEFTLSGDHIANAVFKSRLSCLTLIPPSQTHGPLYMFDFTHKNKTSRPSAPWRLTVLTAAHALLVCRLPARFFEREMAIYLALHGIPFKTLQDATTLGTMPMDCHPARSIPHRPHDYKFQDADYMDYINGTQEILSSPRCGRTALMRGGFPWRVAMMYVSLYDILDGPTGLSLSHEDIFMVTIPGTNDLYVDDALTEIEAALLCGLFHTVKDSKTSQKKLYYPPEDVLADAGLACGRWTSTLENLFSKWAQGTKTGIESVDAIWEPVTYAEWRHATVQLKSTMDVDSVTGAHMWYENAAKIFIEKFLEERLAKKKGS